MLDAAKSLGVDTIASYVPWQHHERREGGYDLRELEDFLALVAARGLHFFARPGPYIYAEWRNLGVPDHAVPFAKHTAEFRRKAAHWIAAVMKVLAPHLGKLVVAVQADNEIDPMPHFYGEDQGFAVWLERRYGSIESLNRAWGASYAGFGEPLPTLYPFVEDARYRDGQQYRYDLATDYARWVVAEYRKHAGATPIVLNTWPYVNAQNWRDLAELADVFGIDPYPSNECRDGTRELFEQLRLLRMVSRSPFIAEFGAGIWRGAKSDYTSEHYRLLALAALAGGVRGWNWYMLADRDNWSGAPINARGVVDAALGPVFARAVRDHASLAGAPAPETSCAVVWSWRFHQTAATRREPAADSLLQALHETGIEYDFVDPERDLGPPRLLLVGAGVEDAGPLWAFAERGGTLVFFQHLADGCARPDGTSHHAPVNLEVSLGFSTDRPVFAYRKVPGEPIVAVQRAWPVDPDQELHRSQALGRRYVTGYVQTVGRGRVLVVGCAPSRAAILAVHRYLGVPIPALPLARGVYASKRGAKLVLVNPGAAANAAIEVGGRVVNVELERAGGAIVELA